MIYGFLKRLFKISLFFFFKRIVVRGKEHIPAEGPLIIVANHPNTMVDPILIASIFNRRIGFIAKSVIFINKLVSAILNFFHIIPIIRKSDLKKGENLNNNSTFVKCHDYLAKGRTFLIFPEGISLYELKLREIKTGTARIALSFEELHGFKGNLKILPVALDYSDAIEFRSSIALTIDKPINVSDYKEQYEMDKIRTVSDLTEDIREAIERFVPHTSDKDQENFLIKVHKFYKEYMDTEERAGAKRSLWLRNKTSKVMHAVQENNQRLYESIELNVLRFFKLIKQEELTTGFFTDTFNKKNKWLVIASYLVKFVFLLPVYILGMAVNYIPYILPYKLFKASKLEIEFKTSIQMVAGLFLFPLFYWIEIVLFQKFVSDELWFTLLLPPFFVICGFIAMYYWTELRRFSSVYRFYMNVPEKKKQEILQLKDKISRDIKNIELTYLNISE